MLIDWDVYHLHLGAEVINSGKHDGFVQQCDGILLAKIDDENFYFIDVMTHKDFEDFRIIKIIHNNWPDSIKHAKVENAVSVHPSDYDISHYNKLRKAGFTAPLPQMADGTCYIEPGGGHNMAKEGQIKSIKVQSQTNRMLNMLRDFEDYFEDYLNKIDEYSKKEAKKINPNAEIKLERVNNKFFVKHINSDIRFELPAA